MQGVPDDLKKRHRKIGEGFTLVVDYPTSGELGCLLVRYLLTKLFITQYSIIPISHYSGISGRVLSVWRPSP
jgi:hypothetical protein